MRYWNTNHYPSIFADAFAALFVQEIEPPGRILFLPPITFIVHPDVTVGVHAGQRPTMKPMRKKKTPKGLGSIDACTNQSQLNLGTSLLNKYIHT